MIESSASPVSNGTKRNVIIKDLEKLLFTKSTDQKILNSIASNELIDTHIKKKTKKEFKRYLYEENRKRKLENLYSKKRQIKPSLGLLVITSEKKQITERFSDVEKKTKQRSIFNNFVQSKTYYTPKTTLTLVSETSSPQVTVAKPAGNQYENWKITNNYSLNSKVFIIAGNYPDIRKALLQRGWIENLDAESTFFDLKWSRNARVPSNLLEWQLYNHFPRNFELSVKWELYENIKRTNAVTNMSYTKFFPRSFRLDNKGKNEFLENYKAIYAISVLKNYKDSPTGYYYEQIVIANIICKRWANEIEKQICVSERKSSLVKLLGNQY